MQASYDIASRGKRHKIDLVRLLIIVLIVRPRLSFANLTAPRRTLDAKQCLCTHQLPTSLKARACLLSLAQMEQDEVQKSSMTPIPDAPCNPRILYATCPRPSRGRSIGSRRMNRYVADVAWYIIHMNDMKG